MSNTRSDASCRQAVQDVRSFPYYAYLALVIWLPLPLGSARIWAWSILELWVYLLGIAWLWDYARGRAQLTQNFYSARLAILLFGVWLVYGLFQITPLPQQWLEWLSPAAARVYAESAVWVGEGAASFPLTERFHTVSVDWYASSVAWFKSLAYVLIFVLTLLLVDRPARLKSLAYVLVFSGLFQAFYGSMMTLSGLEYGFFHRKDAYLGVATGTFVNRNHLAGYLVMCLSVGIGLLIANLGSSNTPGTLRQRFRSLLQFVFSSKMRLRLYLAVMVIALVLTRSRMGNTAFFASMFIAGVIALLLWKRATRPTVVLLVSLIVIDLLILGAWFGIDRVAERLGSTNVATETRADVNRYTLELWREYRLTGTGAGTYYSSFPRYRQGDVAEFYNHAHNDYFQFLAESGAVGVTVLGLVVALSLGAALVAQRKRRDPLMRGMAFAATMGVLAILIHATVDFNLQIPSNAATFMVLLAICWISLRLDRKTGEAVVP